jgi:hypothetical protein
MRKLIPSPALLVALLALVISLGGTTYAVSKIGTAQLKANAVTSPKIKNSTIKLADLNDVTKEVLAATGTDFDAAYSTNAASTTSTSFINVPGMTGSVKVPPGKTGTVVALYTAESTCDAGASWCAVRILLDGVEMNPQEGTNTAFDGSFNDSYETNALQRISVAVPAGTHTVQIQYAVIGGSGQVFRLDDHSLLVSMFVD